MDITQLITEIAVKGTMIIGAATIIFRTLEPFTKWTKSKKDDMFVSKVLDILTKVSKFLALNKKHVVYTTKMK